MHRVVRGTVEAGAFREQRRLGCNGGLQFLSRSKLPSLKVQHFAQLSGTQDSSPNLRKAAVREVQRKLASELRRSWLI
jgi:hypothetical protein